VKSFIIDDRARGLLVADAIYPRLSKMTGDHPFFPHLKLLNIRHLEHSTSTLSFFHGPSLSSLFVSSVAAAAEKEFQSFLQTLADEAPSLSEIHFGPDVRTDLFIPTIPNLRALSTIHISISGAAKVPLRYADLVEIGSLPHLNSLSLNCAQERYSCAHKAPNPQYHVWEMYGDVDEQSAPEIQSPQPSQSFLQLSQLDVVGGLELIEDLTMVVTSGRLETLSVHLICPYPKAYSAIGPRGDPKKCFVCQDRIPFFLPKRADFTCGDKCSTQRQDKYIEHFLLVLRTIIRRSANHIGQLTSRISCADKRRFAFPPALLTYVFGNLPNLHHVVLVGWSFTPNSVESTLGQLGRHPHLQVIILPLGEEGASISLRTLRRVAESCPSLRTLQCRIDPTSDELAKGLGNPGSDEVPMAHGLTHLSTRGSRRVPSLGGQVCVARYLNFLFPHLETIEAHGSRQWGQISLLVKLCQAARQDDERRLVLER